MKEIEVAVSYTQGTNSVNIGLYSDSNGVPGTALLAEDVSNLPAFGSCCATMVVKDKSGIPVTAGTQYWVVLSTDDTNSDLVGDWNANTTDQVHSINLAANSGSGWTSQTAYPAYGFAVLGK